MMNMLKSLVRVPRSSPFPFQSGVGSGADQGSLFAGDGGQSLILPGASFADLRRGDGIHAHRRRRRGQVQRLLDHVTDSFVGNFRRRRRQRPNRRSLTVVVASSHALFPAFVSLAGISSSRPSIVYRSPSLFVSSPRRNTD